MASHFERFARRITIKPDSECWLFAGDTVKGGYQRFAHRSGRYALAHRWLWQFLYQCDLPRSVTLDHTCRNVACVNPDHLEPVSQRTNNLRGVACVSAVNARKTHCPQGHPYDLFNTVWTKNHLRHGARRCRACLQRRRYG